MVDGRMLESKESRISPSEIYVKIFGYDSSNPGLLFVMLTVSF